MAVVENEIEDVGFDLAGNPRWWTITNGQGSREVIRIVLTKGEDYCKGTEESPADPKAPQEMLIFALLRPGQWAYPPFACAALRLGQGGWDHIEEAGGRVVLYPTPLGHKLELMLVGVG